MQLNYYIIKQLSIELNKRLKGLSVLAVFKQNKNEFVLGVGNKTQEMYLRLYHSSNFQSLTCTSSYARARNNTQEYFESILDYKIKEVNHYEYDRAFYILFENNYSLHFRLYGGRTNVILFDSKKNILETLVPEDNIEWFIAKEWEWNPEKVLEYGLKEWSFLGKLAYSVLLNRLSESSNKLDSINKFYTEIENADTYYISKRNSKLEFSVFPNEEIISSSKSIIEILSTFTSSYLYQATLHEEKTKIIKFLQQGIDKSQKYIVSTEEKYLKLMEEIPPEEIANILMANLHLIKGYHEEIELDDFYRNSKILIKLKPSLSPQLNAANYYRKGKNRQKEYTHIQNNIQKKVDIVKKYTQLIEKISPINDLKTLRLLVKEMGFDDKKTDEETFLFKRFVFQDFEIMVGRNSKNNDELTQHYAHKNDLWLHVKGVSGSHVVVRHKAGKKFTMPVIERAAELAGFYSKLKNDTFCPVSYTLKKFVRKIKGGPPGSVIMDKEEVINIRPRGPVNE